MENSVQKSQAYLDLKKANRFLKKKLMNILEYEICKEYKDINTTKICHSVKSLDRLDGLEEIPEEFAIENFAKRFNTLHNMNLTPYNNRKK